jgi:hypothetical protein
MDSEFPVQCPICIIIVAAIYDALGYGLMQFLC